MSTDLLRRAATLLRGRAQAATQEAWFAAGTWLDDMPPAVAEAVPAGFVAAGPDAVPVVLGVPPMDEATADPRPNMEYIAMLHPPVALVVADWLDATATEVETFASQYAGEQRQDDLTETDRTALAVARAILRDEGEAR